MKKAIVLLSGGLDSTTCLAIAKAEGYQPYAISFAYGQRHTIELQRAKKIARRAGVVGHAVVDIDLAQFGGSALTDSGIEVPKHGSVEEIGDDIPSTYVPARNTVFLSLALAYAETIGASDIFIGVNALDYSGYPDCRPQFIEAFQNLANVATKSSTTGAQPFSIHAPLIEMSKAEIIRRGMELEVDYGLTISCYDPVDEGTPCGECDACLLRAKGFSEAGYADPAASA